MKKTAVIIVAAVIICSSLAVLAISQNIFKGANDKDKLRAEITVSKSSAYVNENITFDSSNSTGNIIEWFWDFGDGKFSNSPKTAHNYTKSKYYFVYLTVKDKKGNKDIQSVTMTINNIDYYDSGSGQILMTPRQGFASGSTWLYFPVFDGTTNATVFANWTLQGNYAFISLIIRDYEGDTLYYEELTVNGNLVVDVELHEFKNYGEDYRMGIYCDMGYIEFSNEAAVCY